MSAVPPVVEQRVVMDNISWSTYESILHDAEVSRGRITYDQGLLEIMAPGRLHENINGLIGRMIETYTEVMNIDISGGGSTTLKRDDLKRGCEPDKCYYIQNMQQMLNRDEVDLTIDPPPDLVVEVDITRSSIDKLGIFRAMQVPEVWRYEGDAMHIHTLDSEDYTEVTSSAVLPGFPLQRVVELLDQRGHMSETQLIRNFRTWLEEQPRT